MDPRSVNFDLRLTVLVYGQLYKAEVKSSKCKSAITKKSINKTNVITKVILHWPSHSLKVSCTGPLTFKTLPI